MIGFLPRQVQPYNWSGSLSSARIRKHDKVLKQEEQERVSRVEEKKKTKSEELLHQQKKNRGGFDQELLGPSINKEERILRLMEEEAPSRSETSHKFVPAKRNDTVKSTGLPKYLPIKTSEIDRVDYGITVNIGATIDMGRRMRGMFTNSNKSFKN